MVTQRSRAECRRDARLEHKLIVLNYIRRGGWFDHALVGRQIRTNALAALTQLLLTLRSGTLQLGDYVEGLCSSGADYALLRFKPNGYMPRAVSFSP